MSFDVVCFDCDSTLSAVEGIDELALWVGLGHEMAQLTDAAMNGDLPLEAVYERRLSLIKPDCQAIELLARRYIDTVVDGAVDTIKELLETGKQVHIISGGIRQAILPLADYLGVLSNNVHAVDIYFDADGNYRGFDSESPLARSGGKAEMCAQLSRGGINLVMVGDGQTDLESKQAGAYVIGFGGVVARQAMREQADVFVEQRSLQSVLPFVL